MENMTINFVFGFLKILMSEMQDLTDYDGLVWMFTELGYGEFFG